MSGTKKCYLAFNQLLTPRPRQCRYRFGGIRVWNPWESMGIRGQDMGIARKKSLGHRLIGGYSRKNDG